MVVIEGIESSIVVQFGDCGNRFMLKEDGTLFKWKAGAWEHQEASK